MSISRVQQTAEAICGGLYRVDWEWLGDTDSGASSWFIRGDKPKQVRIEVVRSRLADVVLVNFEWLNLSLPGRVIRGRQTAQVECGPSVVDAQVFEQTERVLIRALEILKDVVSGEGVASRTYVENVEA